MSNLEFKCKCGTLKGVLQNASRKTGSRVMCYCKDCQAGAHHLHAADVMNSRGGTEIFQTIPSVIKVTEGAEHLNCMRLSPKGLMRWYADCCDTPMFNTLATPKLSFAGVIMANVTTETQDGLGPVVAVNKADCAAPGPEPLKSYGYGKAGWHIMKRNFAAKMRGDRDNMFFDPDGKPVVDPIVLTLEERKAATPD